MKFDTPAGTNPLDAMTVLGKPLDRYEARLKTTGTAVYAYEHHDIDGEMLYGWIVGAGIAKGTITGIDTSETLAAPGVVEVVTHRNAGHLGTGEFYVTTMLAAPQVDHYHQPVAVVVAETFEQARHAASLLRVDYQAAPGRFSLEAARADAPIGPQEPTGDPVSEVGDFDTAYAAAEVRIDQTYVVPDQAHAMMEPHATIARWDGDRLTAWTSIQQMNWGVRDVAACLHIEPEQVHLISPYIGGGFGGKGSAQTELILAAVAARLTGRPVKIALQRAIMFNNTIHRPKTIQRVRLGADRTGALTAVGHDSWSGNLEGGRTEPTVLSTRSLYAGANRQTRLYLATLDLAEGNAMRAPGEAPGQMAFEIAMDELAEQLDLDPVELRLRNDTQTDPEKGVPFSTRNFAECLRRGAEAFGWSAHQAKPGAVREGEWLIGLGMAGAVRAGKIMKSSARVRLGADGTLTVEADMTDIGTGSYTIVQQTAAEMMGLPPERIVVQLGDSEFPETPGSGGQQGAASVTAGVYAACTALRADIATRLGLDPEAVEFAGGEVRQGEQRRPIESAVQAGELVAEETIEFDKLAQQYSQQTFGAHFAEVAVNAYTGETRVRRMLAVCDGGRVLNAKTARSQVIGGMVMGVGAALLEELQVDTEVGFFANHDLTGYEVPSHADIPHLDVILIEQPDPTISPVKAKGLGELGLTGVAPAVANAVYNATGVRVREYPLTLEKHLAGLPALSA